MHADCNKEISCKFSFKNANVIRPRSGFVGGGGGRRGGVETPLTKQATPYEV